MSKPVCEVMVGLPGTGKSTLVKDMYDVDNMFVYSTDNYIEKCAEQNGITYDEVLDAQGYKPATKHMNEKLDIAVRSGQDIVWDQTNLSVKKRAKIIRRMRKAGYQIRCSCIIPPEAGHFDDLKVLKRRLEGRPGKTIPETVITNMWKSYVLPTSDEGFDMITFYSIHGALVAIDYAEPN